VTLNRVEIVERRLDAYLEGAVPSSESLPPDAPLSRSGTLTVRRALALFEDQVLSRALDVTARELKRLNQGFYTISSAGHEQNAVAGALVRTSDPCFLHYRSGALMMSRLRQQPGSTPVFDTLLGLVAASDDPTSGGRHKVWGSRATWVPPQTSTIASHVPKAVGTAFALSRARRIGLPTALPSDTIVVCSFGDASANHATALAGINAARYSARKGTPTPVLFLCEDNGIGISVETPRGWIQDAYGTQRHLHFFDARGELDEIWETVRLAVMTCRTAHAPVFLRLETVRLWGHAGTDVETGYRSIEAIEAIEARDPILQNARFLVERGAAHPATLRTLVQTARDRVQAAAREVVCRPKLTDRATIMAPLAPHDKDAVRRDAVRVADPEARQLALGGHLPENQKKRTLAAQLNAALADALIARPNTLLFGEDVGKKGGVYGLTMGLAKRFGAARVFDTLLDETTILGVAQGAGHLGLLPIPEIQYLAYIHNALDQLRGEACSLAFFSNGQFTNPMVVRIAGLAYQKGFGGHFHNDDSIGALRDIPGLALCVGSRPDRAVKLLRAALAMAQVHGRVVAFLEPIALYHERDLFEAGDNGWLSEYPPHDEVLMPGDVCIDGAAAQDILIVSYANGLRLSLRAARRLEQEIGVRARVLDLCWLNPLPFDAIAQHAAECGRVLVVDECRATAGGVADAIVAQLAEHGPRGIEIATVRAADSYVPLGPAADLVLVQEVQILAAARRLVENSAFGARR